MDQKVIKFKPVSKSYLNTLGNNILKKYFPEVFKKPMETDIQRFFECDLPKMINIKTGYDYLPNGIDGFTDSENSIVELNLIEDPNNKCFCRSTTAHESSHGILHVPALQKYSKYLKLEKHSSQPALKLHRQSELKPYQDPEWQAWQLAGALLMPEKMIRQTISENCSIHEIARIFGVNTVFVKERLRKLGINSR